jgi:hypothetical protein
MSRRARVIAALTSIVISIAAIASADDAPVTRVNGLEPLVPDLASHPYRLDPGPRPYEHRFSVSPSFGWLGSDPLFSFRLSYNPNPWLGYEASVGHDHGQSVDALLHTLSAVVRRPMPGRFQPYATGGYGMMLVFPGRSLNADAVTKNVLLGGGGLEFYIRNDLAIRADVRQAAVFGRQRDREGVVVYQYTQETIGLAFYRTLQP